MTVKIALNGMGRIGRCILRHYVQSGRKDIEIVAVNAPGDVERHVQLLKYDSVHGILNADVSATETTFNAGRGDMIRFDERDPESVDWGSTGADVVLECTGHFNTVELASKYTKMGAKKVIISAPSPDADATIVLGVNENELKPEHRIISIGSCTTNCLAPIAKIMSDALGIESGFVTTVHAYTNDQNLADAAHKDLRRARAAALSMIPTTTGAAKTIGKVIPELSGKLDGTAIRVPVPNVSMIDFQFLAKRDTTVDEINKLAKEAANGKMKGVLGYSTEPLVSVDFNGNPHSSIFDTYGTYVLNKRHVRLMSWYDNEFGFSVRMLDVAALFGKM